MRECTSLRFDRRSAARLVSFHLAAADLEAAAVVGLAVHVVQALAAYQRGEEGFVNRQAHRFTVWSALLRRLRAARLAHAHAHVTCMCM